MVISINEFVTDKAIEIIGQTDRLLQIAQTSLNKKEREKLIETASRISVVSSDIKAEVEKMDK